MTRRLLTLILMTSPGAALAHVGHIGMLAGHDHWVAGAAIGAAVAVGIWGALQGKKKDREAEADAEAETDGDAEKETA